MRYIKGFGNGRVGSFVSRRRYGGTSGGAVIPSVALQLVGSDWHVFSGNTDPPDAYFQDTGSEIHLMSGASSGLDIVVNGDDSVELFS